MSWFGELVNGILGGTQTGMNYDINQKNYQLAKENYEFQKDSFNKNYELQKDSYNKTFGLQKDAFNFQKESYLKNFEYQKNLQQQIFGREDNAIQRRVSDLQKAGLSKTLAAGDGAGAGSVVSTSGSNASFSGSPFNGSSFKGSAPQRSYIDLVSTGLTLARAMTDMRKVQADTENALKQNQVLDSQILNDSVNRDYTRVKMAIENGNLDMLGLTREQKQASISHTNAQIRAIDEQIQASIQNRKIGDYKLSSLLPAQYDHTIEVIANLKKQGKIYDADLVYRNLQSDLLVQNINQVMFNSRIAELDYYYQVNTGFKPRSASPVLGDVMGSFNSNGYKSYLDWLGELGNKAINGYKDIVKSFKKDKTPR